jgi:hypothetical protein
MNASDFRHLKEGGGVTKPLFTTLRGPSTVPEKRPADHPPGVQKALRADNTFKRVSEQRTHPRAETTRRARALDRSTTHTERVRTTPLGRRNRSRVAGMSSPRRAEPPPNISDRPRFGYKSAGAAEAAPSSPPAIRSDTPPIAPEEVPQVARGSRVLASAERSQRLPPDHPSLLAEAGLKRTWALTRVLVRSASSTRSASVSTTKKPGGQASWPPSSVLDIAVLSLHDSRI